ncbi:MAG: protein-L-isoaspartate(D-aspartate) O-methyltransferase [Acidimicrobiia bacterium]|nr:protein-L-isoaspartate(D-aspartate) O-methyltransferase [Acidimicrobiia bacterium]
MRATAWLLLLAIAAAACAGGGPATPPDPGSQPEGSAVVEPGFDAGEFAETRADMVETQIEMRGVSDPMVLDAMRSVPRHLFVSEQQWDQAYADHPLPIGHGQTISQPYMVALMSENLDVSAGDRVLEIGTGSGYQAAVLGQMGMQVFTIEIIPELARRSGALLSDLGYTNVQSRAGDGYFGWEEEAPFDAIIVTAAPDHVPQPLVGQLAPGARMVIPVGPVGAVQTLWRFTADESGELIAENLGPVLFVEFTRD